MKALVNNRRATFDFEILDTYEAGMELFGYEVKAVRQGKGALKGAHVLIRGNEAYLAGASIPAYQVANAPIGYDPERVRRLLLSRKDIGILEKESAQRGLTLVPIMMYNKGRLLKLQFALARGKKKTDKRETIKSREDKRAIERTLKNIQQS